MEIKKMLMNLVCVGLLGMALPVAAARNQSWDKGYNFKGVKNVYVVFDAKEAALDSNAYKVAEGAALQSTTKNIGKMAAMGKSFKFKEAELNACQVKVAINVKKYESQKVMIMGTKRKLLGKVNIVNQSMHGKSGTEVAAENRFRNEELPAYETESLKVVAEIKATDMATGRTIWLDADEREKTNGNLENTTRGDLLKRIIGDFWTDFLGALAK